MPCSLLLSLLKFFITTRQVHALLGSEKERLKACNTTFMILPYQVPIFFFHPFLFLYLYSCFFFLLLLLLLTAVPHVIHLVPHAMGPPNHNVSLVVPAALPTMVNVWIAAPMVTMPIKNVKNVLPVRRAVPHVPPMVFVLHAKTTGRAIKKENVLSLAVKIAMNVSMNLNFCANCVRVCVWVCWEMERCEARGQQEEHAYRTCETSSMAKLWVMGCYCLFWDIYFFLAVLTTTITITAQKRPANLCSQMCVYPKSIHFLFVL